jgi:hypothetical protein
MLKQGLDDIRHGVAAEGGAEDFRYLSHARL